MKCKELPPCGDLWEEFEYAPLAGKLHWRNPKRGIKKATQGTGTRAKGNKPYLSLRFRGGTWKAHRLIWKWVKGVDPGTLEVDHRNRKHDDNSWVNLRLGTGSQNQMNRDIQSNNSTGVRGVHRQNDKFGASIQKDKVSIFLGSYDTVEEAASIRLKAEAELFGDWNSKE